eukprot:scaffold71526_cov70-Phaeocystis_antarctica.AAC.1
MQFRGRGGKRPESSQDPQHVHAHTITNKNKNGREHASDHFSLQRISAPVVPTGPPRATRRSPECRYRTRAYTARHYGVVARHAARGRRTRPDPPGEYRYRESAAAVTRRRRRGLGLGSGSGSGLGFGLGLAGEGEVDFVVVCEARPPQLAAVCRLPSRRADQVEALGAHYDAITPGRGERAALLDAVTPGRGEGEGGVGVGVVTKGSATY